MVSRISTCIASLIGSDRDAARNFLVLVAIGAAGAVIGYWLCAYGFPAPKGDDSFYKSPAAELAEAGVLRIPCAKGFLPRAEVVYGCYPPLYQLLLGAWYSIFGFSIYTTLGFSYFTHTLAAIAVAAVAGRRTPARLGDAGISRQIIVLAVGIIHLANLAYFDRQEEVALLWLWLMLLVFPSTESGDSWLRSLGRGVCIGLAWLTSPWAGMLGGLYIVCQFLLKLFFGSISQRPSEEFFTGTKQVGITAGISIGMAASWFVIMELLYPGIIQEQFIGMGNVIRETQFSGTFREKVITFSQTAIYNPPQLPATLLILAIFPLAHWHQRDQEAIESWSVYFTGVVGFAMIAIVRPIAYTYLGATQMFLLPCLASTISNSSRAISASTHKTSLWRTAIILVLGICVLFSTFDIVRWGYLGSVLSPQEQVDSVYRQLKERIAPGEPVAALSRHWYVFQGRNPWREAHFSSLTDPSEVLKCRWLVLTKEYGIPGYIDYFELVEESSDETQDVWSPFNFTLWRRVSGPMETP